MKQRIFSFVLIFCMLVALVPSTFVLNVAADTTTTITLDPTYLQLWVNFEYPCQMNTTVTGANPSQKLNYYSTDNSIVQIDSTGNVTATAVGEAYIYAEATDGSGAISNKVLVKVVESSPFDLSGDSNQKITLGSTTTSRINVKDFLSYPSGEYGSANIALWYNNAKSVVTITCDDNIMEEFPNWITAYNTYGIPVTFMAPTSSYWESGNYWRYINAIGMSVQSHSHYHRSAGTYNSKTTTTAQDWMDFYLGFVEYENATGEQSLTIGYPCGYNNATYSKLIHIAGRGTTGATNKAETINYNATSSYSGAPAYSKFQELYNPSSSVYGGWLSVHYHSANASTIDTLYAQMKNDVDSNNIWAATFTAAAQYGQERDTAKLQVVSADENEITFTLTDEMMDSIYDHPLSVKILVDSTWVDARAYQNGEECTATILEDSGNTYVMVNAIPDNGIVRVLRTTTEVQSKTDSEIRYTIVDNQEDDNDTLAKTSTFTVDDTWTRVYAEQDGKRIEASVETFAGKTTVYVTAYPNKGAVVLQKTTSNVDLSKVTSVTMTQVYNNDVTPVSTHPVTISSYEEMDMFAELVNLGTSFSGITIQLTCDLDYTDREFERIGWEMEYSSSSGVTAYKHFSGIFDGCGHTLSNVELNMYICNVGIFGATKGATIQNLDVTGNITGYGYTGALVGYARSTTIQNCSFEGTVTGQSSNQKSGNCIGGLVGVLSSSYVKDCTCKATVIAHANTTNTGNNVGGIAGTAGGTCGVLNTSFVGSVTADTYNGNGGTYVGGIVGTCPVSYCNADIGNCYVEATVKGEKYVGGIVGYFCSTNASQRFYNNAFIGTVEGTEYVGGAIGCIGPSNRAQAYNCLVVATVIVPETAQYKGICVGEVNGTNNQTPATNFFYMDGLNGTLGTATITKNGKMLAYPISMANIDGTATQVISTTKYTSVIDALNAWATTNASYNGQTVNTWTLQDGATYPTPLKLTSYTVTFYAQDGTTLLGTSKVMKGSAAQAPEAPDIEGYAFTGWSKDVSSVKSDMTVCAQYAKAKVVTFKGKDGSTILQVKVPIGTAAQAPEAPEVEGFKFTGWDIDFSNIQTDLTVTAQYEARALHTVTFKGFEGALLSTQQIYNEKPATAPTAPEIQGYSFEGWNKSFDSILDDTVVEAIYVKLYTVKFYSKDQGTLLDTQTIKSGEAATAPTLDDVYGYRFTGWSLSFDAVTSDLEVVALYDKIPEYQVVFTGFGGVTLSTQTVLENEAATAPTAPEVEGYKFIKWSQAFDKVTSALTIQAEYSKYYVVSFYEQDGTTLIAQVDVIEGQTAEAPTAANIVGYKFAGWSSSIENIQEAKSVSATYEALPQYTVTFLDEQGGVIAVEKVYEGYTCVSPKVTPQEGYVFTGWSKSLENIKEDQTIQALYKVYDPYAVWDGKTLSTQLMGSGTEDDPYMIVTPEDFMYFRLTLAAQAKEDTYFELYGDIYLNDETYSNKFDTTSISFAGHLNGNGATIYRPFGNGLFTTLTGTVENLKIYGAKLEATSGVYGVLSNTMQNGAHVDGCQVLEASFKAGTAAGIVGSLSGTVLIENCVVSGTFTTGTGGSSKAVGYVGSVSSPANLTIKNCINEATCTTGAGNSGASGFIGGLGENKNVNTVTIIGCVNNGTITASGSNGNAAGFLASAYRAGTIIMTDCINNGAISTTNASTSSGVAGFCANLVGNSGVSPVTPILTRCVNNGAITSNASYAGGMIGYCNGLNSKEGGPKLYGCTNNGTIKAVSNAGGMVGWQGPSGQNNRLYLYSCASYGDVIVTASNAGGMVGSIFGCLAGDLFYMSGCCVDCKVQGNTYVGGVIGMIDKAANLAFTVKFTSSYVKAEVSYGSSGQAGQLIGGTTVTCGVVPQMTSSYFDITLVKGGTIDTTPTTYYAPEATHVDLQAIPQNALTDGTALAVLQDYVGTKDYVEWSQGETHPIGASKTYTITFLSDEGVEISKKTYSYGMKLEYPENPTKEASKEYTYTFSGWGDHGYCFGDATYKATFKETAINYEITFIREDGSTIEKAYYHYGDTVTAPTNPTKDADSYGSYTFKEWDRPITTCDGNATYIASFTLTYTDYTVTFQMDDGQELSSATYHYGDRIVVPEDPTKEEDDHYTYTFSGWSKTVSKICAGNATYKAVFTKKESAKYLSGVLKANLLEKLNALETVDLSSYTTLCDVQAQMEDLLESDTMEVQTLLQAKMDAYTNLITPYIEDYEVAEEIESNIFAYVAVATASLVSVFGLALLTRRFF